MVRLDIMQTIAPRMQTATLPATPVPRSDSLDSVSLRPMDLILPMASTLLIQMVFLLWRPSLDGHEALVAQTAREMVRSGDFLHPSFAGEPRWQKPPLAYWQVAGISWIMGRISPKVARLPSLIGAVAMTALVVLLTRRFASPSSARTAGVIHSFLPWTLVFGTSAIVDMTLSLLVASCIVVATSKRITTRHRIIFAWSLAALSILAKGPIGPAVILGALVPYSCATTRRLVDRRSAQHHAVGLLVAFLVAGTWPLLVLLDDPSIARGWWEQSVGRFAEHWGEQTREWYYYFYQVPALVGPAFVLTVVGMIRSPHRMLLGWFGFTFFLLSFSEGKRDHYILPALLPCSVWAGLGWAYVSHRYRNPRWQKWVSMSISLVMLLATAASLKILPGQNDPMSPLQKMARRQRTAINQAPSIAQIGSNNHATAFILDRPMRWYPDIERCLATNPRVDLLLIMNRPSLTVPTTWRLIDQEASSDSKDSFRLYEQVRPRTSDHAAKH